MIVELPPDSKVAFAMISHPRLGAASLGFDLDDSVVRIIVEATLEENRIVRVMAAEESFELKPANGSWAPRYVAIDWLGHIVVSDYDNHQVKVFSGENGSLLQSIGGEGKEEGQLTMPLGVAVSREGNFVVADSRNHRLQVFGNDGSFLRTIGCKGKAEGELEFPMGVAVDGAGNIAVADWGNNRVQIFDGQGNFQRIVGRGGSGAGELKCPSGVAVNESGTILVVADGQNHRVQLFEADGTFQRIIGHPDSEVAANADGDGELNGPMGIALDAGGNIMVADKSDRIQVFRQDGTFIRAVGRNGRGRGELNGPGGVAVDGAGNIVVADCKNRRVQVFASATCPADP
jgi:DNA-binding beta-propeller fold protein YncE